MFFIFQLDNAAIFFKVGATAIKQFFENFQNQVSTVLFHDFYWLLFT